MFLCRGAECSTDGKCIDLADGSSRFFCTLAHILSTRSIDSGEILKFLNDSCAPHKQHPHKCFKHPIRLCSVDTCPSVTTRTVSAHNSGSCPVPEGSRRAGGQSGRSGPAQPSRSHSPPLSGRRFWPASGRPSARVSRLGLAILYCQYGHRLRPESTHSDLASFMKFDLLSVVTLFDPQFYEF